MFELPQGTPVNEPITLIEGELQPFAHGVISSYAGRRKTPVGHRLVRGGRIVGWVAEADDKKVMLGGAEARAALEALEANQKVRHLATSYTLGGLGRLADTLPEAFEHQADKGWVLLQTSLSDSCQGTCRPSFGNWHLTQPFVEQWPLTRGC